MSVVGFALRPVETARSPPCPAARRCALAGSIQWQATDLARRADNTKLGDGAVTMRTVERLVPGDQDEDPEVAEEEEGVVQTTG